MKYVLPLLCTSNKHLLNRVLYILYTWNYHDLKNTSACKSLNFLYIFFLIAWELWRVKLTILLRNIIILHSPYFIALLRCHPTQLTKMRHIKETPTKATWCTYVWPCITYENNERYQLEAKIVIYYHKYLYMFRASICPSSGVQVVYYCIWCSAL